MSAYPSNLDGNSWEALVKLWLTLRYPNDFQEIPAADKGDAGLEGYCICDGLVYQCYCPMDGLDTKSLYENQRDKLTTDIGKFIDNKVALKKVLPRNFKVKRYCFVVPEVRSRTIVEHANTQTQRVRGANLDYAAGDFAILVQKREAYAQEQRQAQLCLLKKLNLELEEVEDEDILKWVVGNNSGVQNLDRKLQAVYNFESQGDLERLREYWIRQKIRTDNALEKLRSKTPDAWEKLLLAKRARERLLGKTYHNDGAKHETVSTISERLASDMIDKVPNLERIGAETLADGLVGGWLQDCKLNFPSKSNGPTIS